MLDFNQASEVAEQLAQARQQRFIGVVYRPHAERTSHYLEASIGRQYDAYVWLDETSAVEPLDDRNGGRRFPDTYPFGM